MNSSCTAKFSDVELVDRMLPDTHKTWPSRNEVAKKTVKYILHPEESKEVTQEKPGNIKHGL